MIANSMTLTEASGSSNEGTYTVALKGQPSGAVSVAGGDMTVEYVTVTIKDEEPGVSATSVAVQENLTAGAGRTGTWGRAVVLDSRLRAGDSIGIEVTSSNTGAVAVSGPSTPLTMGTAQGDADGGDEAVTVSHCIHAAADSGHPTTLMIDSLTVAVRIDIADVPADMDGDGTNEGRPH